MTQEEVDVFRSAISRFGIMPQLRQLCEECSEVQIAAHRLMRNRVDTLEELAEELADVSIMRDQMIVNFEGLDSLIDRFRDEKIKRLKDRLSL